MLQDLNDTDWSKCLELTCVDAALHEFKEAFMNIVNIIAPVKEVLNIDNFLTGENIVRRVVEKVNARLKFLYRHRKHLDF